MRWGGGPLRAQSRGAAVGEADGAPPSPLLPTRRSGGLGSSPATCTLSHRGFLTFQPCHPGLERTSYLLGWGEPLGLTGLPPSASPLFWVNEEVTLEPACLWAPGGSANDLRGAPLSCTPSPGPAIGTGFNFSGSACHTR